MSGGRGYPEDWDEFPTEDYRPLASDESSPPVFAGGGPVEGPGLERTLRVRHCSGEVRAVAVEMATEDGALHVRWPNGAGVYVVHVFKIVAQPGPAKGSRCSPQVGPGLLFRTAQSRTPLLWRAESPEEAKTLWRQMTGRQYRKEWITTWENGKRKMVAK